ncbi:hypothetical protein RIF29_13840 [Crotalaria pallida]|uniref:Uncharacterized protein n=1 Tax=Crotalaria pallida TaxID=3830 RepID=A0AAN9ID90_CROPI
MPAVIQASAVNGEDPEDELHGDCQSQILRPEKVNSGSPNLLTFPSIALSLSGDSTHGRKIDNGKKRASKEVSNVTNMHRVIVHVAKPINIRLSGSTQSERATVKTQPSKQVTNKGKEANMQIALRKLVQKDLIWNPEFSISPNLLKGITSRLTQRTNLKSKPPDLHDNLHSVGVGQGRKKDVLVVDSDNPNHGEGGNVSKEGTSAMVLDSGQ